MVPEIYHSNKFQKESFGFSSQLREGIPEGINCKN